MTDRSYEGAGYAYWAENVNKRTITLKEGEGKVFSTRARWRCL